VINFLAKILGDKKEWKAMEARANALPPDYRIVYGEMKTYMWRFASGNGSDVVAVLEDVLDLFETNAAQGTSVVGVTGTDVAAFCDARLTGAGSYLDSWRATLNRDVARKLASTGHTA
jgi:DNA-binding ferritin-like protein (Dps family)